MVLNLPFYNFEYGLTKVRIIFFIVHLEFFTFAHLYDEKNQNFIHERPLSSTCTQQMTKTSQTDQNVCFDHVLHSKVGALAGDMLELCWRYALKTRGCWRYSGDRLEMCWRRLQSGDRLKRCLESVSAMLEVVWRRAGDVLSLECWR